MPLMFDKLEELQTPLAGRLIGENGTVFHGVNTDTRSIKKGDLFVALVGEKDDGHDFIDNAISKGAAALITSHEVTAAVPSLVVDDTAHALGRMGALSRLGWNGQLTAVTGSNGKTTVKEMLGAILSQDKPTLITADNENNQLGVPLTLLKLSAEHKYAVVELGTDKPGEIAYSASLIKPSVAIINNAGKAHLGGFGDEKSIAEEKGSLLNFLAADGVAVLNADDEYFPVWKDLVVGRRIIKFGCCEDADVKIEQAEHIEQSDKGISFNIVFRTSMAQAENYSTLLKSNTPESKIIESKVLMNIPLLGKHNAMNAAAACAAAWAMNIKPSVMQQALKDFSAIKGRLDYLVLDNGCFLIDDSYNANPVSMEAALRTLADLQLANAAGIEEMAGTEKTGTEKTGTEKAGTEKAGTEKMEHINRVAILGNMHELGESSSAEHKKLGELAADLRINTLLTCGDAAENCLHSFRQCFGQRFRQPCKQNVKQSDISVKNIPGKNTPGKNIIESKSFNTPQEVNDYLDEMELDKMKGTIFLVKGSRASLMEKVAQHVVHKLGKRDVV